MGRRPKFTDDEVLDRAMTLLWSRGPAQVSVRDLEDALGMKAPSIYHRFGSMDGVRAAVLDHYIDRVVMTRVARLVDGRRDPVSNLSHFLERSVTEGREGEGLIGCLLTTTSTEHVEGRSPELQSTLQRGLSVIEEGIAHEVRRADDFGLLSPHTDADQATAILTLAAQGLMTMARAGVSSSDLRARARATIAGITTADADVG